MKLETYLKNRSMSPGAFARQIGVSRNAVKYWCDGKRRPTIENTLKIEAATDRLVTVRDFMEMRGGQ